MDHAIEPRLSKRVAFGCLAFLASFPAFVAATPYTSGPLVFTTTGQSMWGPGNAPGFDVTVPLIQSWNTPTATIGAIVGGVTTIPCVPVPVIGGCVPGTGITIDTRTGGTASASTMGQAGFRVGAKADSGSVAATVSYVANLTVPDSAQANQFVNLNPTSAFSGTQNLSTNSPEFSSKADAVLGAKATLGGTGCFIPFGCASGSTTVGFDPQTLELVAFNQPANPGQVKILGVLDPALFQFGEPFQIPPNNPALNFGNVTVHIPDINTSGGLVGNSLKSSGADDFLDLRVDLDGVVLNAFGLPAVLGTSVSAGPLNVSYDLIDVEFGPTLEVLQSFELVPTLMVDLDFSQPVNVQGLGMRTSLTAPWDLLPSIAFLPGETIVTPEFSIQALFKNMTTLGVDGVFDLLVLRAGFSIEAFGLSLDIGQLGPLFRITPRTDLFTFPTLFSNQFNLGGFASIDAAPFVVRIPEPEALLLAATALLAMALVRRRRAPGR
jgi:hypothetical protein